MCWEQDESDPGIPKYSPDLVAELILPGLQENRIIILTYLQPSATTAATNVKLPFYISTQAPPGGTELKTGSVRISLGTETIQSHLVPFVSKGHYFDELVKSLSVSNDDPELFSMHLSFPLTKMPCKAISVFHHFSKM